MGGYSIIIRLEARLRPNIGFSLLGDSAVFTGSAQTLPKVNRFGWNLEYSEYIVGGWSWHILGAIRLVATVWESGKNFCHVNSARFQRFCCRPNFTKFEHNSVDRCHDENVWNRILKILPKGVVFSKKRKYFLQSLKFQRFAISGHHNYALITDRPKVITK